MLYQNEEIDPLVGTRNEAHEVKNQKDYRTLGGLVVILLCVMAFLTGQSGSTAELIPKSNLCYNCHRSDKLYVRHYGHLKGNTQGTYIASKDTFNSKPIFDRVDGKFFAFMTPDRRWGITYSKYRDNFVNKSGVKGAINRSYNESPYFYQARYKGDQGRPDTTIIDGELKYNMQGTYKQSTDYYNNYPIWDREDGKYFAFMQKNEKWGLTASKWRESFVGKVGNNVSLLASTNKAIYFSDAVYPGQKAVNEPAGTKTMAGPELEGSLYYGLSGTFIASSETWNGKPIWDRTDGRYFAVWNPDGYWYIEPKDNSVRKGLSGRSGTMNSGGPKSITKCDDFRDATFDKQFIVLKVKSYAYIGGVFTATTDTFNGKPIWVRSDKRFFAFKNEDGKWALSKFENLSAFISKGQGSMDAFRTALNESESFIDAWFPGQTARIPNDV